jgi:hypothetical protein
VVELILSESARMRYEAVSLFLVVLVLAVVTVRWLWNRLVSDFPKLPRMTFGRALGVVSLWGLLFLVVLTMIAATREMMTPGVWEKQGLLYRIPTGQPAATPIAPPVETSEVRLLVVGWAQFLWRNLGQVTINPAGVATGLVAIVLLLGVTHYLGRWLFGAKPGGSNAARRQWRFSWSLSAVILLVVMFIAGFSTVGLARHLGWLLSSNDPVYVERTDQLISE